MSELANLTISRSSGAHGPVPYLRVDLGRWRPAIGERIMALGFADLDVDHHGDGDARAMTQYMFGSEAAIMQVEPPDGNSSRPWPRFRVEAEWPGGMSGGPIFNEAGYVVGLVSTGLAGQGVGTATYFAGRDISERTFSSVDASNPGWLKCWIAFDAGDNIVDIGLSKESLEHLVADGRAIDCRFSSIDLTTGDHVSI